MTVAARGSAEANYDQFSARYRWYVVLLLALVNVVNYMDRMLLSVLLPFIKADLQLTDTELGLISGFAFAIFYAVFGLPLARLADVWVRRNIIAIAMTVWSLMTAASGAAQNFWHLMAARIGVGAGEAGCIPPSHSMISDIVPPERRASAFAVHTAGATVGMIVGLSLGGFVATAVGWRWTFVIFGLPGLLLTAIVFLTVREPRRGGADDQRRGTVPPIPLGQGLRELLRTPSYLHLLGVFGFATLASFGFNQWLPSFYDRSYAMTPQEIGLFFGVTLGLGSAVGTLFGGWFGDRLMKRNVRHAAFMGVVVPILALPFWLGITLATTAAVSLACNFMAAAISSAPNGVTLAMVQSVAPTRMRALASALVMFSAAILGIGGGPFLTGFLSDYFQATSGQESLRHALFVVSFFTLIPAIHYLFIARTIRADMERQTNIIVADGDI